MKKTSLAIVLTILSVVAISTSAMALFCTVDPNPQNNGGSCQANSGGGATCYISGSGPGCSGTGGYEPW